ncbi:MAG: tetratricopeptide repeat protein [Anaerolineae bacterium]|jgi:tetratricopeptide (TPR) repeat protein|nr:tetratricopeptide repeat protein [Anaerolineae bacterium]
MANDYVKQLLNFIDQLTLPTDPRPSDRAKQLYQRGKKILNTYRGNRAVLQDALRIFAACGSQPYAYAGIAQTIMKSAFEQNDDYDQDGLAIALDWLQKAQTLEPDDQAINLIEAVIYMNMNRFDDARLVLDHLIKTTPITYALCMTEINYWDRKKDLGKVEIRYKKALSLATDEEERQTLIETMAGVYLMHNKYEESLKLFEQVVKSNPQNPWAWHNMSVMYFRLQNYPKAAEHNRRALALMDFGAARQIQEAIKKKFPRG